MPTNKKTTSTKSKNKRPLFGGLRNSKVALVALFLLIGVGLFIASSARDQSKEDLGLGRSALPSPQGASYMPMIDYGGPIMPQVNLKMIWWGSEGEWWNNNDGTVTPKADVQAKVKDYLDGVNGSSRMEVTSQYMRGATPSVSYDPNIKTETEIPIENGVYKPTVEVREVIEKNYGPTLSQDDVYVIFTEGKYNSNWGFAWHDFFKEGQGKNAKYYKVIYIPKNYDCTVDRNNPGYNYAGVSCIDQISSWVVSLLDHEIIETQTNPIPNLGKPGGRELLRKGLPAWQAYPDLSWEAVDLCGPGKQVTLTNGKTFSLQAIHSNRVGGCEH